jgi:hypothetical protein
MLEHGVTAFASIQRPPVNRSMLGELSEKLEKEDMKNSRRT